MSFQIKNGEKILFIGDSITDCGRRTEPSKLGDGYVKMFSEMMIAKIPEAKIEVINKGISGNTILDLENRWTDDMIYLKPDWLSILVGINDTHRVVEKTVGSEELIPDKYRKRYSKLLQMTVNNIGCKIILIEPFFISTDTTDSYRGRMLERLTEYRKIVAEMSEQYGTLLLKIHDIFQKHLKYRESETFCAEPVHPNHTGHLVIAQALYDLLNK